MPPCEKIILFPSSSAKASRRLLPNRAGNSGRRFQPDFLTGTNLDTLPRYRFDASKDKILENA